MSRTQIVQREDWAARAKCNKRHPKACYGALNTNIWIPEDFFFPSQNSVYPLLTLGQLQQCAPEMVENIILVKRVKSQAKLL